MKNLKNALIALLLTGLISACSSTQTGTGTGGTAGTAGYGSSLDSGATMESTILKHPFLKLTAHTN